MSLGREFIYILADIKDSSLKASKGKALITSKEHPWLWWNKHGTSHTQNIHLRTYHWQRCRIQFEEMKTRVMILEMLHLSGKSTMKENESWFMTQVNIPVKKQSIFLAACKLWWNGTAWNVATYYLRKVMTATVITSCYNLTFYLFSGTAPAVSHWDKGYHCYPFLLVECGKRCRFRVVSTSHKAPSRRRRGSIWRGPVLHAYVSMPRKILFNLGLTFHHTESWLSSADFTCERLSKEGYKSVRSKELVGGIWTESQPILLCWMNSCTPQHCKDYALTA